ncbi:hypothetical protein D3C85_1081190 [compost metagenome]
MLVAQGAQALHEVFWRDGKAAFALHWLKDDRGDIARLCVVLEDALDAGNSVVGADAVQCIGVQGTEDATRHQAHASGVGHHFAGQRQGVVGAAMVGAGEGDHASAAGVGAGDLDGVFHGFGTGGDQQGLLGEVARNQFVQLLAQLDVWRVGENVEAGVGQLGLLGLHGRHDFRVQVAGIEHGNAAGKIEVLATFDIPDGGVFSAVGEDLVDLANATRNGVHTTLLQGLVGIAHACLMGRNSSGLVDEKKLNYRKLTKPS